MAETAQDVLAVAVVTSLARRSSPERFMAPRSPRLDGCRVRPNPQDQHPGNSRFAHTASDMLAGPLFRAFAAFAECSERVYRGIVDIRLCREPHATATFKEWHGLPAAPACDLTFLAATGALAWFHEVESPCLGRVTATLPGTGPDCYLPASS